MRTKCFLLLGICAFASASLHSSSLPSGWVQKSVFALDSPELRAPVSFVLALKEDEGVVAAIKKTALAVSDPDSPSYGQFLNAAQIDAMTAPKTEDLKLVTSWLETAGVTSYTVKGSRVEVLASIGQAEKLFDTTFVMLVNEETGQAVRRAGDYYIPQHIQERVQAVFGLHGLPLPKTGTVPTVTTSENRRRRRRKPAPPAAAAVTPAVLEKVYSITGVTPKAASNKQAVAEFQGETMSDQDLADFFKKYVTNYTAGKDDKVSKYVGDKDIQSGQTEASLDIQYIMGVNPGLKTEFWLYNSKDFCGDLANWTAAILADDNAPFVHSVSYGWQGDLKQLSCTEDKIKIVDDNFAKLAAKGISIIIASGDTGAGVLPRGPTCGGPDKGEELSGTILVSSDSAPGTSECCDLTQGYIAEGKNVAGWSFVPGSGTQTPNCTIYESVTGSKPNSAYTSGRYSAPAFNFELWPSWPASSGWVTSVGSTRFVNQTVGAEQMATDQFGSGGGFSMMFTIAKDATYQADAVKAYLAQPAGPGFVLPPAGSFPTGGRATPDLSALGEGYQVLQGGETMSVGGTSASTPAFAGMVALVNDARISAGKKQMGFLNPWVYKNTDAFTDITKGNNAIGRGLYNLRYGFNCTKGWDPVTGVGTPIFNKLLAAAMKN